MWTRSGSSSTSWPAQSPLTALLIGWPGWGYQAIGIHCWKKSPSKSVHCRAPPTILSTQRGKKCVSIFYLCVLLKDSSPPNAILNKRPRESFSNHGRKRQKNRPLSPFFSFFSYPSNACVCFANDDTLSWILIVIVAMVLRVITIDLCLCHKSILATTIERRELWMI